MKKPPTPFPVTGYYGPSYFCDREAETRTLLGNIAGGSSTILTARRRIGKTALIHHVLGKLPRGTRGIYMDILATENPGGFLNELGNAVIRNTPQRKGPGRRILDFILSLRPILTFDPLTGAPQVSFTVKEQEAGEQVGAILNFLERHEERIVIAIDEFQQILRYPEKNCDAWLRSLVQKLKNVVFIFCGSQQHLMNELFTIPSRPFYNSAGMLRIGRIDPGRYRSFMIRKFSEGSILLTEKVAGQILDWADHHTYYVQLICNRLFVRGGPGVSEEDWKEEADRLLREHEPVFFNYRNMLTNAQWQTLKATARENELYEPTSHAFISKHSLGSPATVLRNIQALLGMELIYFDYSAEGRKYYKMNDLLFRRWVEGREF